MKRAFPSLDPQEALHAAIFIEERNAQLYQRFAEMFMEFHDAVAGNRQRLLGDGAGGKAS